jgi:hypothetical protein
MKALAAVSIPMVYSINMFESTWKATDCEGPPEQMYLFSKNVENAAYPAINETWPLVYTKIAQIDETGCAAFPGVRPFVSTEKCCINILALQLVYFYQSTSFSFLDDDVAVSTLVSVATNGYRYCTLTTTQLTGSCSCICLKEAVALTGSCVM